MTDDSAEANIIRDELRNSIRALDASSARVIDALLRAESFLRGERKAPRITTIAPHGPDVHLQTPADMSEPGWHLISEEPGFRE